ncbi:hypothetical protein EDB89DRAFT_1913236 [Lactarius sanguifluus]|nr:hypothetical protein EDB89DRAFT_1913236 [Lactarius sanguifluus]
MMVSSESQGAWRGGGGGAGLVTWHAGLCVAAVLRQVGGLVRGGPAWWWSGVVWVEVTGGMGLAGVTTGWRSDIMPAWWWRCVVDGRGWAMMWVAMSERKKRKKKKGLNKVGSQGHIVAVGGGVGMTSRRRVGGVGGNVGQSKRKGLVGKNISRSARPSSSSSCVSQRHGVGAELSHGGVPVVEIDGDGVRNDMKKKKPLPISSSSAAVLGGFAQRGDDGGELEATAGAMG